MVTAAKRYGCKAVGVDIDPARVREAQALARKNGVEHLVHIEERDLFTVDLSDATVVTLYLLPHLNARLIPQLQKLAPGSRIVSHEFETPGLVPERVGPYISRDGQIKTKIYLWKTPLTKTPLPRSR